jgi:glyoxylate/hydroxypyruvate reductase A
LGAVWAGCPPSGADLAHAAGVVYALSCLNVVALLLKPASEPAASWIAEFQRLLPELEVRVWPAVGDPESIEYALVANLPPGELHQFPNLRMIVSLPVGLDHLLNDPLLPKHVPMTRCISPAGDPMMTEFALLHVLRHHRQLPAYLELQRRASWHKLPQPTASERRVGVMGLGAISGAVARALAACGFDVAGWARTPKHIDGVRAYAGSGEREAFLQRSDILVCLLPATSVTRGMLNKSTFAQLPRDAAVINLARGDLLVETDLIAALDARHLSAATLDVTIEEPLPAESPLWSHPRITITPHVGGVVRASISAPVVADNIQRLLEGAPLLNRVDVEAGY